MSNKHTDTIDEILRQVAIMHDPRSEKEAKAALSAMVAEIIGEDDEPRNTIERSRRNFLRAEQRQRAIAKGFTL